MEVGNKVTILGQEAPHSGCQGAPGQCPPQGVLGRAAKPLLPLQRAVKPPLFSFGSALCGSRKIDI